MTKQLTIFTTILLFIISLHGWQPALADTSLVLITEVQTGLIDDSGTEFPRQEFIEITNLTSVPINLTGWKLEYLSAANDGSGAPTQTIDTINGQIGAAGHGIWEHEGYYPIAPDSIFGTGDTSSSGFLAKSGGHVRLMNGTTMVDCVSWGSAVAISGCDKASTLAGAGYTIQRPQTNGQFNKAAGVANIKPATPQGNNIYAVSVEPPIIVVPPVDPLPVIPATSCDTVELSEVLANPAGDDAQGEFIELHNPTNAPINLLGCSLQLNSGKQYSFKSTDTLEAYQYKSFTYSVTGLQLGNNGASVTLVRTSDQITTTYPAVGDDEAWAYVSGSWQITRPTPGAANLPTALVTDTAVVIDNVITDQLEPCPLGKYRSPATNRCRTIGVLDAAPAGCQPGQERNPSTGRCRKISAATVQVACQPNQERNPQTGRCRKIETTTAQKPCEAGQERNSATGRCKKTDPKPGKVLGATTTPIKRYHYLLVGVILAGVITYAVYEYRHNLAHLWHRLLRHQARS